MTALVPLNNPEALPRLHAAGVGEVYVGFHDEGWERRFAGAELNRMSGFGREANPFDFAQMCEQIAIAHELGMRAFVCFNATTYARDELDYIAGAYLPGIAAAGAHGVILSSQGLIGTAREAGLGVTISTIAGVYNSRLAAYYRNCGATRVILPRDLSSAEIAGIVEAEPDLEYEVFLMRNGCLFSDSHCLGCHRAGHPSLCMSLRTGTPEIRLVGESDGTPSDGAPGGGTPGYSTPGGGTPGDEPFLARAWENEWLLNERYHKRTCGLCALWRFEQLGVDAYKVVGRGDDIDDLCEDAALVMRNIRIARASATEADYLAAMERPREPETLCGNQGLSCYYPELSRKSV